MVTVAPSFRVPGGVGEVEEVTGVKSRLRSPFHYVGAKPDRRI